MTRITAQNSDGFATLAGATADPVLLAPSAEGLCVLLVRRQQRPFWRRWALPGGFIAPGEAPTTTAQRKLTEKTGVGPVHLEQLATYGDPQRDPRGWIMSVAYLALVPTAVLREGEAEARWHAVAELPALAFDHATIVRDAVDRLRGKLWYSNIGAALLPEEFTVEQARQLYESILGVRLDASNFRRSMESSELVERTGRFTQGGIGRPAELMRFRSREFGWSPRRAGRNRQSPATPSTSPTEIDVGPSATPTSEAP